MWRGGAPRAGSDEGGVVWLLRREVGVVGSVEEVDMVAVVPGEVVEWGVVRGEWLRWLGAGCCWLSADSMILLRTTCISMRGSGGGEKAD